MKQKVVVSWINENKTKSRTCELRALRVNVEVLQVARLLIAPSAKNFQVHSTIFHTATGQNIVVL